MRVTRISDGLKVHAVAGTYVVLFGFDLPETQCDGLLGFSIHRSDHTENEASFLTAMKAFAETDPGFPAGSLYSTQDQPIQSFQWADYTAKPGHDYTYTITALKGTPTNLTPHAQTIIDIGTESPESGNHDVYFNRGVAGSQAYVRRFGDRAPEEVPNRKAFEWLSRGLNEALEDFVRCLDVCLEQHDRLIRAAAQARAQDLRVLGIGRADRFGSVKSRRRSMRMRSVTS